MFSFEQGFIHGNTTRSSNGAIRFTNKNAAVIIGANPFEVIEIFPVRRFVCLFLLVLLPLHGFAMQGGWISSGKAAFSIAHEMDHLTGTSHHHDDEHGGIHYDDSQASAEHLSDHSSAHGCAAIPPSAVLLLAARAARTTETQPQHYLPDPYPQRLQRPPSTLG